MHEVCAANLCDRQCARSPTGKISIECLTRHSVELIGQLGTKGRFFTTRDNVDRFVNHPVNGSDRPGTFLCLDS